MENQLKLPQDKYEQALEWAKHAIGMDGKRPFRKDGCIIYVPYRNYFSTVLHDPIWQELAFAGLAAHGSIYMDNDGTERTSYSLTPNGIQWLAKELRMFICIGY